MTNRIKLDAEQAASLVADGEDVAVGRIGVDNRVVPCVWDRCEVFDSIRDGHPSLSGPAMRRRGLGVTCYDLTWGYIYVATKPDIDWASEEAEAIHRMTMKEGSK